MVGSAGCGAWRCRLAYWPARWPLESRFVSNVVTGVGSGVFRYYSGGDDISGSVTMLMMPGTEFGAFDLNYTVETGSGRLAGFSGLGRSTVTLLGPQTEPPRLSARLAASTSIAVVRQRTV